MIDFEIGRITSETELEALYDAPVPTSILKEVDHITDDYRKLIEASPFAILATSGPEGLDCSPRGDPSGFVLVADPKPLMIPDRRGNNRIDSLRNIVRDPRVALLFLIPGIGTTMRVNGKARLSADPELCATFAMEGKKRLLIAEQGIAELGKYVDSLITIPNEKLLSVLGTETTLLDAFKAANEVLQGAVQGIAELITRPGLINVDFADVRTVMSEMGMAMMGSGTARGTDRAREAAEAAISSPLLEDINLSGARGILVNVTGGENLSIGEFNQVGEAVKHCASEDATVVIGTVIDPEMGDMIRVTVVATGLGQPAARQPGGQEAGCRGAHVGCGSTPVLRVSTESLPRRACGAGNSHHCRFAMNVKGTTPVGSYLKAPVPTVCSTWRATCWNGRRVSTDVILTGRTTGERIPIAMEITRCTAARTSSGVPKGSTCCRSSSPQKVMRPLNRWPISSMGMMNSCELMASTPISIRCS